MTPLKTKILIADDHPIVLNGLRTVLNVQPDLEVVAQASDGEEAVQRALAEPIDLAILDISMPRKTALQAPRATRSAAGSSSHSEPGSPGRSGGCGCAAA